MSQLEDMSLTGSSVHKGSKTHHNTPHNTFLLSVSVLKNSYILFILTILSPLHPSKALTTILYHRYEEEKGLWGKPRTGS